MPGHTLWGFLIQAVSLAAPTSILYHRTILFEQCIPDSTVETAFLIAIILLQLQQCLRFERIGSLDAALTEATGDLVFFRLHFVEPLQGLVFKLLLFSEVAIRKYDGYNGIDDDVADHAIPQLFVPDG